MIRQYLNDKTIRLKIMAKTREDAIRKAAEPLLMQHKIKEEYVERMLNALKEYGPYMVLIPGIAMAHAEPGPEVLEECMSMITLETPVVFGHESNDPVHTVFVLGSNTKDKHMEVLMDISKLLMNDEFVDLLKHGNDAKEFQAFFERKEES